jgi:hypothetical protein
VRPRANGIVVFACRALGVFEAGQVEAPFPGHMLVVGPVPHVAPLARAIDEHPAHALVVADSHLARLFVIGLGTSVRRDTVERPRLAREAVGGWSPVRLQRHAGHSHLLHAKAVVDALDRLVHEEEVRHVTLAGDEVILPLLEEQLPPRLKARVIATMHLDIRAADHDVMRSAERALGDFRVRRDRERAAALKDRALGRDQAVLGVEPVLEALDRGQVYELVLSTGDRVFAARVPEPLRPVCERTTIDWPVDGQRDARVTAVVANELVVRAQRTGASIAWLGDPALLADVGHVGAHLRFSTA